MGQLIDEDDCAVCVEFKDGWIFTYGDLVTLLLCFFILLFSMCKMDAEKISAVSQSFRPMPPGSPFAFKGKSSVMDEVSKDLEQVDMPDDVTLNVSDKGVAITFKDTLAFETGSVELTDAAKKAIAKAIPVISSLPNNILISGHTDSTADSISLYPSTWELSTARAAVIATYLESLGIPGKRMQIAGYGHYRPRFYNDTAYKRGLNRRVEILLLPEDQER
ncbi:flagellar motor protein MotB [Deltaproteobacteria bacterium TL4]